ncbi:MAG: diaminopimelate decarboxylase [Chloroflexota bacterium]
MFHYKQDRLYADQVDLAKVLKTFGTPLYVYDANIIRNNCRDLLTAFAPLNPHLHYSVKANSNLSLLRLLHEQGAGFDIVSGGELARLQATGVSIADTSFAGVGKSRDEILQALQAGIRFFNVESEGELARIADLATQAQKSAQILLRLNPNVDAKTHKYITTGKAVNKFGLSFEIADTLCDQYAKNKWVDIVGFHMHIGSQVTTIAPYVQAAQRMVSFIQTRRQKSQQIDWLNLGGGFGIQYQDNVPPISTTELATALLPILADQSLQIILEPGRSLIGPAGILLTEVQYVKQTESKRFIIVDSGMHHLIRPALYGGWHKIWPIDQTLTTADLSPCDVVGPICESTDFLAQDRLLPEVNSGDVLAVFDVGAYGFVMASNYNSHLRPAEILVDGDRYRIIRHREQYQDLMSLEVACL